MKPRYKFRERIALPSGDYYVWWRPMEGDSRVEEIHVRCDWFWDPPICGSRGPRIGGEGQPVCKRPPGHKGLHKPRPDDGWGQDMAWGDPW